MSDCKEYIVRVYDNRIEYRNKEGYLHRLDGPAIEWANGSKSWCQNGLLHRVDGPAIEYTGGRKEWLQNGKRHRLDGPAIKYFDGSKSWYIEDIKYTEEEFNRKTNPVKELTVAEIQDMLGFPIKVVKG